MKIPQKPPSVSRLFHEMEGLERFLEIRELVENGVDDRKYLHWDQLRFQTPPEGLSHEEWWHVLKLGRIQVAKTLPLQDCQGKRCTFSVPDAVLKALHKIDQHAGGRIEFPEPITHPDTRDRYVVSSLIEEAITSSQLEGAATTREVAKEMIRQGRKPRDKSEQMILNNYRTMKQIREYRNQPLTPELVFALHRLVTEKTLENEGAGGRFRLADEEVHVVSGEGDIYHQPPPAEELEARLTAMCAFANGETPDSFVHPALRAVILHFWLAYDHPFVDGNGRTARALFYWSMLRSGYWLFEFVSISSVLKESPVQYERSFLYTETDDNDLTYFILDEIRVIQKAMDRLIAYLERKAQETRQAEVQLTSLRMVNHRQSALLQHALKHPGHRYSIASHQRSHQVAYQTARTDLLSLVRQEWFTQSKVGKTFYFFPVSDLQERLVQPGENEEE